MDVSEPGGRVLVVDDEPAVCSVLNEALDREGYRCRTCSSGEEALNLLREERFDVVITDLYMPGLSGMGLIEQGMRVRPDSAFLMATGEADARVGVEAMKHGAVDYLVKPFQLSALVASVRRAHEKKLMNIESEERSKHLQSLAGKRSTQLRQAFERIEKSQDETLGTLGVLLEVRDNESAGHGQRVCLYTIEIAEAMRVPRGMIKEFARAALLHDIGKVGIPDEILLKPGKLTPEQMAVMKTHVRIGYELLRRHERLRGPAEIVLTHHERFDGSGYPQGLKRDQIPLGARIFTIADTLDAITTDRPYRRAASFDDAFAEIKAQSGSQFDPQVVEAFFSIPASVWMKIRGEVECAGEKPYSDWLTPAAGEYIRWNRRRQGARSRQFQNCSES